MLLYGQIANWIVGSIYLGISLETVCSICNIEGGLHSTYCMLMLYICTYIWFACFYVAYGALSAQRCMGWMGGEWMVKPSQIAGLGQMTWFDMYFCNMDWLEVFCSLQSCMPCRWFAGCYSCDPGLYICHVYFAFLFRYSFVHCREVVLRAGDTWRRYWKVWNQARAKES